jgi:hypothetical protein
MRSAALRRLLRRTDVSALLSGLASGEPLALLQPDGALLWGEVGADPSESIVGPMVRVRGARATEAAAALTAMLALEAERRALAQEVLGLYREVNLLYTLTESLSGASDRTDLARRTLAQATRIVTASSAAMVIDDDGRRSTAASFGAPIEVPDELRAGCTTAEPHGELLVAPLLRGALLLAREKAFTAADLKLAVAVAGSAASVLARIHGEEDRSAAAAAREQHLRRQIEQLRVELDGARRDDQVRQITESDYFAGLRSQAETLRQIVDER